jgi:thioredoxin-related protein
MPRGDKEVSERNKPLVVKYKIQSFPTVLLLDSDGKEFSRFVASEHPDPESFLKRLDQELERKDLD